MTEAAARLPLVGAALALVEGGATPEELARRFASTGAELKSRVAELLLNDLLGLGLVTVAQGAGANAVFVPTSLGKKAIADGVGGSLALQLADLETLRTDLLSTIAHELRTPLTAVRTSVGLLIDETSSPTDEQRRLLLASIERNADRMQRLVGDILDLARFRSGAIRLQLRRFDPGELASSVIASIEPLADARRQELVLDAPGAVPDVFGDRRRLEQALLNLVSNAQRLSPEGARIEVQLRADRGYVGWRVVDAGPGISPDDQARLFERFFVGRNDRNARTEGVGLGLPTARAIAEAHGGTIEVESELGRGSAFTLVVPADGPAQVE